MLKSLHIQNYAIIDDITIDFNSGFNVFTGETGAGKSIIIGALSFLSDKRADTSIIKTGKEKALIEGVFSVDEPIRKVLDDALIDCDDELIVKRVISRDGNSSVRVNNSNVPLSFLNTLLTPMIDIHSQKDSQYLFNKKNHLILLDRYLKNEEVKREYSTAYNEYRSLLNEFNHLKNTTYSASDLDYISFELKELEDAGLSVEEEQDLETKEKNYKNAEKYLTNLSNVEELYNGNGGIREKLKEVLNQLDIDDETLINEKQAISSLYYDLDDHFSNIEKVYSRFDPEAINIEAVEERLFVYSKLKRKYTKDVTGLLAYKEELEKQIDSYKDRDAIIEKQLKAVNLALEKVLNIGHKLSSLRKECALNLEKEVIEQARDLILPDIDFKIVFNEKECDESGLDDVEFYLTLNRGEELKPLKNIASGGEISRIMLALKIIFARLSDTKLIIFDEIDTGVSGKAALAIGEKMALIAREVQVIAITHLAAVSACAKTHYYIYKTTENDITSTKVKVLEGDDIFKELAIMSNGSITVESLASAISLFENCQKKVHESE